MAKHFGIMLDASRNAVMRPDRVKDFAAMMKKMGYNTLLLYTEDTYEIPEEPYFGYLRGRYSRAELKDIVTYCDAIGVEVIPCIQTLAHLSTIFRWRPYSEIRDVDDILLIEEERTYQLIDRMFSSIESCFTSRTVHVGMDEAHLVGLGRYLEKHGFKDRFELLEKHLRLVAEIARAHGFAPLMWSDMFFRLAAEGEYYIDDPALMTEEIKARCPASVTPIYWDYYFNDRAHFDTMLAAHRGFPGEKWFAGGAWTWRGFGAGNAWTVESMTPALEACRDEGVEHIFITMWGDDGQECSFWSMLPSLYALRRIYDGETNMERIKEEFHRVTGESYDALCLLDLPVDFGAMERGDTTPHKYLLYNDPFLGIFDTALTRCYRDDYLALADRLEAEVNSGAYGYLFTHSAALCRLLAVKHDLGCRTRASYEGNSRVGLATLLSDYRDCENRLETFIRLFRESWFTDHKPHGFDVHELRLGGLLLRLRSQRERLERYLRGETDSIPELEEKLLPYNGSMPADEGSRMPRLNSWQQSASVNRI